MRVMGDPAVYPGLMQLPHPDEEQWRALLAENPQADPPRLR
ncbi:MAG TPA: hypothetical protein VLU41_15705 [Ideonella sp.]|nr:hypothetical protein [Ideonella sp.]